MLARDSITLMTPNQIPSTSLQWDIFCNVIDNYGDIGVSWRIARQLAKEFGQQVRLWVDDLASFKKICPCIDLNEEIQVISAVEIHAWKSEIPNYQAGDIVIEAFGCKLPQNIEQAIAAKQPGTKWLLLEYLSAENWVESCHALPSIHPQLGVPKYFFFPGFSEKTGGLPRESTLAVERKRYIDDPEARSHFLARLGVSLLPNKAIVISLFSYESPQIELLLDEWSQSDRTIVCLVPIGRNKTNIECYFGAEMHVGTCLNHKNLYVYPIDLLPQEKYDQLLWSCDINFVRGEDSFVRAQLAAKPFLWHIYRQDEDAHLAKLDAFLDRYIVQATPPVASAIVDLNRSWNSQTSNDSIRKAWRDYLENYDELAKHAKNWQKWLIKQQDLCSQLVNFCLPKV